MDSRARGIKVCKCIETRCARLPPRSHSFSSVVRRRELCALKARELEAWGQTQAPQAIAAKVG
jgi:hypothetical protein